ncbi:MAG: hypothetical protein V9H69_23760 [Anaerolineae bacterium]
MPTSEKVGKSSVLRQLWTVWEQEGRAFWQEMDALLEGLENGRDEEVQLLEEVELLRELRLTVLRKRL